MKKMNITEDTMIRVYFNSIIIPTKVTYAVEVEGEPQFLVEYPADANDLHDIKEMSVGGLRDCDSEYFGECYYTVRNGNFPAPFETSDIK